MARPKKQRSYDESRAFAFSLLSNGNEDMLANFSPSLNELNPEQTQKLLEGLLKVTEYIQKGNQNEKASV
jgi:hypothetical protein